MVAMGVDPVSLRSVLTTVLGQRLVPALNDKERFSYILSSEDRLNLVDKVDLDAVLEALKEMNLIKDNSSWRTVPLFRDANSPKERRPHAWVGIQEVINISPAIEALITNDPKSESIMRQARREGTLTLLEDRLVKSVRGLTDVGLIN